MRRAKKDSQLGKSLIKKGGRNKQRRSQPQDVYTREWEEPVKKETNLNSILEMSDLDTIAYEATLAEKKFTAERGNIKVFKKESLLVPEKVPDDVIEAQRQHWNELVIPRRYVHLRIPRCII